MWPLPSTTDDVDVSPGETKKLSKGGYEATISQDNDYGVEIDITYNTTGARTYARSSK